MNILKRAKNNLVYVYHRKRRDLAVYMMRKIDKSAHDRREKWHRVNIESLRKCYEAKLYNKQVES
jgi:hypothetical protein